MIEQINLLTVARYFALQTHERHERKLSFVFFESYSISISFISKFILKY